MKKKIFIAFVFGAACTAVVSVGYNPYRNFMKNAMNKEVDGLLNGAKVSAEASFAQFGQYPKTLKEVGFMPVGTAVILKYCSQGKVYRASAIHKKTGYARTVSSDGENNLWFSIPEDDSHVTSYETVFHM